MRNLLYNNNINKQELVKQNGIPKMMEAIKFNDEELKANITGMFHFNPFILLLYP